MPQCRKCGHGSCGELVTVSVHGSHRHQTVKMPCPECDRVTELEPIAGERRPDRENPTSQYPSGEGELIPLDELDATPDEIDGLDSDHAAERDPDHEREERDEADSDADLEVTA